MLLMLPFSVTPKFPYIEADSDTDTVNREYLHATENMYVD